MDQPTTTDPQFQAGVQAFWQAIVTDNPTVAMPFFFPLSAYLQVKAISNPASDWQQRLVGAYTQDIHSLHASLGAGAIVVLPASACAVAETARVVAAAQALFGGGDLRALDAATLEAALTETPNLAVAGGELMPTYADLLAELGDRARSHGLGLYAKCDGH